MEYNMKEKILNSFLSTNLDKLGFKHINSEVPKVLGPKRGKRTDILAYDKESKRPIIIELKAKKDTGVISQLQEYISNIPKKYPHLFEELNAFRKEEQIQFNYDYGVIGLVISPEPPPENFNDNSHTLLWAQYEIESNIFKITKVKKLSESKDSYEFFKSRGNYRLLKPTDFINSNLPNLRKYVNKLHELFLSISKTIYPRYKLDDHYTAYWPTNGTRAVYGFNTGSSHSRIDVEFHIYNDNHTKFKNYNATKQLNTIGLSLGKPRKNQIYPIRITEDIASDSNLVDTSLELFRSMAEFSYNSEIIADLDNYTIDEDTVDKLNLKNLGIK
jgi:hypothetical protein